MLFHLADGDEWARAVDVGTAYSMSMPGVPLAEVGFVHCSYAHQVQPTADRWYRGRDGLVLLTIDPARLAAAVEVDDGFPHVYGPIDVDAVVAQRDVPVLDGRLVTGFAAPIAHVNLDVADVDRSIAFWGRWFGVDMDRHEYDDGTVFVRDGQGFDLAFHPGTASPAGVHVGLRAEHPDVVRSLRAAMLDAGHELTEDWDDDSYESIKVRDPDGYEVEVYWEPHRATGS
jgi:uncharacterized protein (DUF952 family)/catechol 2,3-dioxygenase-like lactoylglutathione lyase family enzyme